MSHPFRRYFKAVEERTNCGSLNQGVDYPPAADAGQSGTDEIELDLRNLIAFA